MAKGDAGGDERRGFEAEVSKLLHLMVHSVYSEREIFLRELISNASDACDRLRYAAITEPTLLGDAPELAICISVDRKARTLTVSDNGIGMSRAELIDNLGTVARSGTAAFVDALTGDGKTDMKLIGQFGVGFYSSFMVADRVHVTSRKAGEAESFEWESAGEGGYVIRPAERKDRGTDVVLHLKKDADEFLDSGRLEAVVRKYSDHIAVPIRLAEGSGEGKAVNDGSALWARSKAEITERQYAEFYRHVSHALDEPALTLHHRAEGVITFTSLLFVPSEQPLDLFDPMRKPRVRLYVRRVFITEDADVLLPGWLRFLRGIVDCEDLPLNISREMLQKSPVIRRLGKAITNKVTGELAGLAEKDPARFKTIWERFGAVIKEGIYEDAERREQLLGLARFRSTHAEGRTSLADYLGRMAEGQAAIYYVTGETPEAAARSPQLEGFKARGIEVLLLSDPVDDFWLSAISDFEDKPFRSITRGAADLESLGSSGKEAQDRPADAALSRLIAALKEALGEAVADVRLSERLTDSAACLVADEHALDLHLERLLRQHGRIEELRPRILEINPDHPLIAAMARRADGEGAAAALADPAWLLLDQARLLEGEAPADPAAFARRLADMLAKSL